MPGSYQTVLSSIIASIILGAAIFMYFRIFPKKKPNYFVLMILLSLLPVISVFRPGAYESGDFNIHVYRTIAFVEAIKDGQFLPSWPKDLNATYGYPLFIWMNAFTYYLISFIHTLGFSFIMSTKLYLIFSYMFSGIAFWFFAKKHIKKDLYLFAATIFYMFAPYHLLDFHFRAAIGEILSFVLLPLFLLCIYILWRTKYLFFSVVLGLIWGLFILTHHAISVFSLGIGIPYLIYLIILDSRQIKKTISLFSFSIILGFLTSLYAWWPHVFMSQYTYGFKLSTPMVSFPTIADLLFSPYRYGLLFQGPNGELSFAIGYTHLLMVALGIFFLLKKRMSKETSALLFFIIMFAGLVFMMTPLSEFMWNTIPLIKSAQFSTRLMVLMTLTTAMIAGITLEQNSWKKNLVYVLITFTIVVTILNWGHRRVIPEIDDSVLHKQLWLSTAQGEGFQGLGNPKWIDFNQQWISVKPKQHIEILRGNGSAMVLKRSSTEHIYEVSASENLLVRENTLYFPGWKAFIDGKEIPINPSHPSFPGVITVNLPNGDYTFSVVYKDIPELQMVKAVSVSTLSLTLLYLFLVLKKKFIDSISDKP